MDISGGCMLDLLCWKNEYSVGNTTLDNQHKNLLKICKMISLYELDGSRESIGNYQSILNDLADYAGTHFHTEEEILTQANYPLIEDHAAEHMDYIDKLTDFLLSATHGVVDKQGLAQYLDAWWINHILESDMAYSHYLKKAA
jgi:hemerythrin-like metal-binding protein